MNLPDDVADALGRAVGAYVRAVPRHELPNSLRPLQAFRPQALAARRAVLLAALDDDNFRNEVLTWLDEAKPDLPAEHAALLRVACERQEGWEEELRERSSPAPEGRSEPGRAEATEAALEQERDKVRRARADAKRARAKAAAEVESQTRRVAELQRDLDRTRAELARLRADLDAAERRRAEADAARDKAVRRAERAADAAKSAQDESVRNLKTARKEGAAARRDADAAAARIALLEAELARTRDREVEKSEEKDSVIRRRRRRLGVPKGRFDDDPQTLEGWLSADGVTLLVDGYNVTKAEGGFASLELETQRERLVADLIPLVGRKNVPAIVVFDGSDVDASARRAFRGPVKVEYSTPDETADDHLVELVRRLPPDPVVVVTSDRELQERLREHDATIATSPQLLALIR
ncbi:MAG TPA: NYN domain-containing protein [Actinomycetota bacterium]|nr:NYN domain-containing protein [Actinomycetota bacterium]